MFLLQANATSLINVADLRLIAPELILTVCACVALVMEVILPYRKSKLTAYFSLVGVALAFVSLYFQMGTIADGFYGMVRVDGFALLFKAIFLISAALAIGISTQIAQTSMTKGLQAEKTGRATMVGYVQIIFAGAWGAMLFGESITLWTVIGAAIVLMGMLSLVMVRREAVGIDE